MTWIKPSFLWLMERSNWGAKAGQEHTLAVRITRAGWEEALAQGVLTGKYKPGQPVPEGSRAADPAQNMFLNGGNLDQATLTAVQKLAPIAEGLGLSMAQLALAWCLRQKNVSSVIIGASRPAQVEDNAGASGVTLSPETLTAMDEALAGMPSAR